MWLTWCSGLPDADWGLHPDAVTNLGAHFRVGRSYRPDFHYENWSTGFALPTFYAPDGDTVKGSSTFGQFRRYNNGMEFRFHPPPDSEPVVGGMHLTMCGNFDIILVHPLPRAVLLLILALQAKFGVPPQGVPLLAEVAVLWLP